MNSKNIKFKKVVNSADVSRIYVQNNITRRRFVTIFSNIFLLFILSIHIFWCQNRDLFFRHQPRRREADLWTCDREDFGEQIFTRWDRVGGRVVTGGHAVWPPRLVAISFAFLPAPALFIIIYIINIIIRVSFWAIDRGTYPIIRGCFDVCCPWPITQR